uniref:Uncharacterized protein n=1 Tax=mine drainage metagenome TaxID=410659 RepID=E6QRL5_9ZZZZ
MCDLTCNCVQRQVARCATNTRSVFLQKLRTVALKLTEQPGHHLEGRRLGPGLSMRTKTRHSRLREHDGANRLFELIFAS